MRKDASPQGQVHNTLGHRRTENRKLEYLEQQIRQLEDQVGEIKELLKR
jgi:hypothetical protein